MLSSIARALPKCRSVQSPIERLSRVSPQATSVVGQRLKSTESSGLSDDEYAVGHLDLANGKLKLLCAAEGNWTAPSPTLGGVETDADHVAVVRSALVPMDTSWQSLNQLVKRVNDKVVSIDPSVLKNMPLVDAYVRSGSSYVLQENSVCMLKYFKSQGVCVRMEPAVQTVLRAGASSTVKQSTNEVLMMAPTAFQSNMQAAQDNYFMAGAKGQTFSTNEAVRSKVLEEYRGLYHVLTQEAGLKVNLMSHTELHGTPDACFPNNWFSTHANTPGGTLVLYPMKTPNRQLERRPDIINFLKSKSYANFVDLSVTEMDAAPKYLEGTGSLVLDHIGKIAYVAISERSDVKLAEHWADKLGFNEVVAYHCVDREDRAIYHTNVVQAVGTSFSVLVGESIRDASERKHVMAKLNATREVVDISYDQMDSFCGNVLEVENDKGLPVLAMSSQAHDAFTPAQRATLLKHVAALHHAPIPTLEAIGGGGVRCCIAEVFAPLK
eukprot:CAMPEP_0198232004 /NCGR_PEP_ID=MMETSP1445-20131203/115499_1 /TAXON_ID=36898 /ORGANISM="Pyramimonas sp., Strain CCMP2087" /LENGTH=494 /DNA_ID=CAMNT_0043912651 /DNA_START=119 /DNA_END=1603 /DNA_ORIENTATION=+